MSDRPIPGWSLYYNQVNYDTSNYGKILEDKTLIATSRKQIRKSNFAIPEEPKYLERKKSK